MFALLAAKRERFALKNYFYPLICHLTVLWSLYPTTISRTFSLDVKVWAANWKFKALNWPLFSSAWFWNRKLCDWNIISVSNRQMGVLNNRPSLFQFLIGNHSPLVSQWPIWERGDQKFTTFLLSETADAIVTNKGGQLERLLVAALEISGSTTQLLVASRVKARGGSRCLSGLESAAKTVSKVTGEVVAGVQNASVIIEQTRKS